MITQVFRNTVTFTLIFLAVNAGLAIVPLTEKYSHEGFEEKSPYIEKVDIKKGEHFVEVFVEGTIEIDCFPTRDFAVQKFSDKTQIIPRFRRSAIEQKCTAEQKHFREKVADLDASNPASFQIEVLGFYGWHKKTVEQSTDVQKAE